MVPEPPKAYRPLGALTGWLVALVAVQVAATAGNIVAMLLLRAFIDTPGHAGFAVGKLLAKAGDPVNRVFYVASIVVFCFWVHRAYRNLAALGSRNLRFTPGWAVGYFFIPLVVFVRGVQIMRDLWIESQPLPDSSTLPMPLSRRAQLVGWWWAGWIVTLAAGRTLTAEHVHSANRTEWLALTERVMGYSALEIATGVMFIAVLVGIARRQREQWDDLVRRQPTTPPSDLLR